MLSLFPQILFLAPVSFLILRVALALFVVVAAWQHMSEDRIFARIFGIIELVIAAGLFVGFWTQAAAILAFVAQAIAIVVPSLRRYEIASILLALIIAGALVFTGPGIFAFDLPL